MIVNPVAPARGRRWLRGIAVASAAAMLGACATGPEIFSNADPAADFDSFRTYAFMQPLGTDRSGSMTSLSGRLVVAVTREMEARGFRLVKSDPDILINFFSSMQNTSAPRQPVSALRGYGGWPNYRTAHSTMNHITEGAIAIDMVDSRSNRLVWEAAATDRVTDALLDNLDAVVQDAVSDMFARFPRERIAVD